ncbi:AAA family ATPase [Actinokineospora terrae]|uniref:Predicted ATP-binding protein involved in virulence n=1 Tax=Actinokineospora terrae TaxID=155974 RepID=A0A1H9XAA9_9PSEU|nr:AAA family ATPase [Actinokineospora terrae]SES42807.1 Predicted ATP-binding protein involved in virulence [Actinokineospora terrae]
MTWNAVFGLLALFFAPIGFYASGWFGSRLVRRLRVRRVSARRERQRLERVRADGDKRPVSSLSERSRLPVDLSAIRDSPYVYLTDLRITDLRCFREARLSLRFPGEFATPDDAPLVPNVNLLIGDNGTGKSTVLRAAAMVALGPVLDSSGFVPYRLVREERDTALVEGRLAFGGVGGSEPLACDVRMRRRGDFEVVETDTRGPYWDDLFDESSPSFFVAGYGVNRRTAEDARSDPSQERGRRRRRFQRVSSLFDETVSLVPFGAWLPTVSAERRREVAEVLRRALPDDVRFDDDFDGEDAVFRRRGVPVPFRALSDGYRSYLGWLGDLLFHLSAVAPAHVPLGSMGGIVLVDEIDLLLHPEWQRKVVLDVAVMFPNIQFILTTHSPIVTGTLQARNILLARDDPDESVSRLSGVRAEVHGLNAEQVLLSSYFSLDTTRAPDVADDLTELARKAVRGDDAARRRYLAVLVDGATGSR